MLKISLKSMTALAAILALGSTAALAQAPAKKDAAPKAAPAAKAPAGDAKAADAQAKVAWVKLCDKAQFPHKDKDGKETVEEKNICLIHHERIDGNSGVPIVSAAIRQVDDKEQFMTMVSTAMMGPLGIAVPPGLRVAVVDKDQWAKAGSGEQIDVKGLKWIEMQYTMCSVTGCTAEMDASKDFVSALKAGAGIIVFAWSATRQPVMLPVPLDGFSDTLAGQPVDPQKYNAARSEMMKQLRERQQAMVEQIRKEQAEQAAKGGGDAKAAPKAAPAPADKKK